MYPRNRKKNWLFGRITVAVEWAGGAGGGVGSAGEV